jgi:hypothetical protein
MRNMSLGITAFVVSVGLVSVGAQGRNFSGTWVVDIEKTNAARQAASEVTGTVVARGGGVGGGGIATGGVVSSGGGGGAVGGMGMGSTAVARGGGGGRSSGTGAVVAGGGGVGVGGVMTAGAGGARGGRGGGLASAAVVSETVIAIDANTFSTDIAGVHTSYPLNGSEVSIAMRTMAPNAGGLVASEGKARASWKGDMLVIETTYAGPEGPITNTTSWFLEGDSLVRLTRNRTYFKRK